MRREALGIPITWNGTTRPPHAKSSTTAVGWTHTAPLAEYSIFVCRPEVDLGEDSHHGL